MAPAAVDQFDERIFDGRPVVGNQPRLGAPRGGQRGGQPFLQGRDPLSS
jgi:hypothetical protein